MKQLQIVKSPLSTKPKPDPVDTRSPSGHKLPF